MNRPSDVPDLSALSQLAPQLASTIASIASDIALVIDSGGVIRNVAVGPSALTPSADDWVGRSWTDTVTGDTRKKIEQLLQEVDEAGVSRRREVNHPGASGPDIPVAYAAVRLGKNGPVLAVGRDLRAVAAIQQRFTDSQQEMERSYWKLRQAESRYRMLFQVATDAVLVVDALTLTIVEANQAAGQLFKRSLDQLAGQPATVALDPRSRPAVEELLATTRATGRPAEIRARLGGAAASAIDVSATPFRGDGAMLLLMRVRAAESRPAAEVGPGQLADFVEHMHDAVVITDSSGRVLMANPAFLDLFGLATESQVKGSLLGDWIGNDELLAWLAQARQQGIFTLESTALRGAHGSPPIAVRVAAAMLAEGDQECVGFTIHRLPQRAAPGLAAADELVSAIERLGAQLGRFALPDLLREAGDLAEHHLINTAIERAGGDRNAAALVLGIVRDELDLRLRRLAQARSAAGLQGPATPLLN